MAGNNSREREVEEGNSINAKLRPFFIVYNKFQKIYNFLLTLYLYFSTTTSNFIKDRNASK